MNLEDLRVQVEKLSPKEGDIVVMTLPSRDNYHAMREYLAREFPRTFPDLAFVILCEGQTLDCVPEETLRDMGWQRVPQPTAAAICNGIFQPSPMPHLIEPEWGIKARTLGADDPVVVE
jgi:hypothetical protein